MGLYDTMQQAPTNPAAPVNGTSAQKQPVQNAWQQKQQMRANPIMQGRPAMGQSVGNMQKPNNNFGQAASSLMNAYQGRMNPTAGQTPGMQGSQDMLKQKQLALKNAQATAQGQPIGGSYGSLVGANPQLQSYRQIGQAAGQDMSWMDKPGALNMAAAEQVQGPAPVAGQIQNPYERQQQEALQAQQQAAAQPQSPVPMSEPEQDMGSQDPRELLRMKMMQGGGQMDVMPRAGLGPSNPLQAMQLPYQGMQQVNPAAPVQMDENGLEPRRGAR